MQPTTDTTMKLLNARQLSLIEKYRYINVEHNWWDSTYEAWVEKLEQVGYANVEINFTGFYSQGDGASFTARVYSRDVQQFMDRHGLSTKYPHIYQLAGQRYIELRLERTSSRYYHECSVRADGELEEVYAPDDETDLRDAVLYELYDHAVTHFEAFVEEFESISQTYMDTIYKELEQDYEYLTSDECVRDTLSANNIQ